MNILILNGSPKGERGLSYQYARRLMQIAQGHVFETLYVGRKSRIWEKDPHQFALDMKVVARADLIVWCTPVYYLLVPAQLKRFIELLQQSFPVMLRGKFAATMLTSIHFYDHIAQGYLRAVSEDMGMHYLAGVSAEMDDMTKPQGLAQLDDFCRYLDMCAREGIVSPRRYQPLPVDRPEYLPGPLGTPLSFPQEEKIAVLTDASSVNVDRMVERFVQTVDGQVTVINIREQGPKSGCLGCIQCAGDNQCVLTDGFPAFYQSLLQQFDCIVYAGTIVDRWLSSSWKRFLDRTFFYGHIPALAGKRVAMLLSGPLSSMPELREMFEAYFENQHVFLVDIISDEQPKQLDQYIRGLVLKLRWFSGNTTEPLRTFLGEGGWKVLRDAVWGRFRYVFEADHQYYKSHHLYDFPQNMWKERALNMAMMMAKKIPRVRREFNQRTIDEITKKSRKILEDWNRQAGEK